MRAPGSEVLRQLGLAGCMQHVVDYVVTPHSVTGRCRLRLVTEVLRDKTSPFYEGKLHGYHVDVGPNRVDWRAKRGAFGPGSLQIVVDALTPLASGRFYADIDKFNPYGGAVGWLAHAFGEVVPGWFERKPKSDAREA